MLVGVEEENVYSVKESFLCVCVADRFLNTIFYKKPKILERMKYVNAD